MLSLFVVAVLFSDLTLTADPGHWLDYSRSGIHGPNRLLLIQHVGEKGQYDQGVSRFQMFDMAGRYLYDMPEMANSWAVVPGILGHEDLYIY